MGCSEKNYDVTTTNGIKTINNHEQPITEFNLDVDLEFATENQNYIISSIADVAEDKDGNVYVLDSNEANIKKFSHDGLFIKTISQKGNGPEDLNGPTILAINSRNELIVYDATQSTIKIFDENGNYVDSYKDVNLNVSDFCIRDDNSLYRVGINWSDTSKEKHDIYPLSENLEPLPSFYKSLSKDDSPMNFVSICNKGSETYLSYLTENLILRIYDKNSDLIIKRHLYVEGGTQELDFGNGQIGYMTNFSSESICLDSEGNIYTLAVGFLPGKETDETQPSRILQVFDRNGFQIMNMGITDQDIMRIKVINDKIYTYGLNSSKLIRYNPPKL